MTESKQSFVNTREGGFSDAFLVHAMTPKNLGVLSNPDGYGAPKGECGDQMEIGLTVREGVIDRIEFITDGCAYTVACGSVVTELARGRTVSEAMDLQAGTVADTLGGLPPDHAHCAHLAVTTLRLALQDYLKNLKEPWKKMYRPARDRSSSHP